MNKERKEFEEELNKYIILGKPENFGTTIRLEYTDKNGDFMVATTELFSEHTTYSLKDLFYDWHKDKQLSLIKRLEDWARGNSRDINKFQNWVNLEDLLKILQKYSKKKKIN